MQQLQTQIDVRIRNMSRKYFYNTYN